MYKIANEEAPDIRVIRKEFPESLANLVALSVSKRPETRYQDGDQFAVDLRSVMVEISGGSIATTPMTAAAGATTARNAGHEKTAVFATAAVAPVDFEKTAIHQSGPAGFHHVDFEKTAIHQPHEHGAGKDPDFEKTTVHQTGVPVRSAPVRATTSTIPDVEI